jgi:hypothetical protein
VCRKIKAAIVQPADHAQERLDRGSRVAGRLASAPRAVCQLRQQNAAATGYDKREYIGRRTVDVASIRIWLRQPYDLRPNWSG